MEKKKKTKKEDKGSKKKKTYGSCTRTVIQQRRERNLITTPTCWGQADWSTAGTNNGTWREGMKGYRPYPFLTLIDFENVSYKIYDEGGFISVFPALAAPSCPICVRR